MSGLATVLAISLAGLLLAWAAIFWLIGRRPRRPRPVFWARRAKPGRKQPRVEPVMSVAELEESFHRTTRFQGKRG